MTSNRLAALADQGLISATNFLMFLYCARALEPADWGTFGFAYAAVLFLQGFQRATVTIPMITLSPTQLEWTNTSAAWAGLNSSLILAAITLCGVFGVVAHFAGTEWLAGSALYAALLSAPMLWMEFARRATIQNNRFGRLVTIALAYTAVVGMTAVAWPANAARHWLPVVAVGAGGIAAALVFAIDRQSILLGRVNSVFAISGHGRFTLWATLSHLGYSGYNFGIQALLGAISGPNALGAFHACRALIQPVNTFVGAMDSIDKPRAARAYSSQGRAGLLRSLRTSLLWLGVGSGIYIVLVALLNSWLLHIAYGNRYADQEVLVISWCVVAAFMVIAQPVESGLYVIGRTREMFISRVIASIASLSIAYPMISKFESVGAVVCMAVGFAASAAIGIVVIRRKASRDANAN